MKVLPKGYHILIKPDQVQEKSQGGIIVTTDKAKKMEVLSQVFGTVLAIGTDCWDKFEEPFAKIGDRVIYQRSAGMRVPDGKGDFREDMLLLNDLDIVAVIQEENHADN